MSYEIIYNILTIKKKDVFIPFVVMGSNNCYEAGLNGRPGRRERNLYQATSFFNDYQGNFDSIQEMIKKFRYDTIAKEMRDGCLQGRYKTAKSIINGFIKNVFDSEELKLKPFFYDLYYMTATPDEKQKMQDVFSKYLNDKEETLTDVERNEIIEKSLSELDETLGKKLLDYLSKKHMIVYSFFDEEYEINNAFNHMRDTKSRSQQEAELRTRTIPIGQTNLLLFTQ